MLSVIIFNRFLNRLALFS
ncbi:hypothetical protein FWK35_00038770 [Aphis craccivora]|uniref:Uncharacterized protein n=1 Tax=Aphis craccivora TaxID=307492 RepID=A0A6G0W157_APHCR|nr:hypothetical protein FWK35_00038770 [Aphis craccivora]